MALQGQGTPTPEGSNGCGQFSSLFLNLFVEEKKWLFTQSLPVGVLSMGEVKSSLAQNNPPFPGHPHTGLLPGTERGVWIPQSSTLLDLLGLTSSWPPCHHRMVGGAGKKAILQAGNYSPSCSPLSSLRVALLSSLACKGSESSRQALPRSSPGVHSAPGPYLHQCLVAPCFKNEMER